MANGWTSREKAKVSLRRAHHQGSRHDDNPMAVTPVTPSDDEIVDVKPLQVSRDMMQIPGPKGSIVRLGPPLFFWFNMVIYLIASDSVVK
jgi:myb proto-oncogene protein